MKKYKYFPLISKSKEAIQIIEAPSLEEAYVLAARIKQMDLDKFKEIFGVEKI